MTIRYFAYGSNMLTTRLQAGCKSARALGSGRADGYVISFSKTGKDGPGKATVVASKHHGACVHGVLFENAQALWQAKRSQALTDLKQSKKAIDAEADLRALGDAPAPPLTPIFVCPEPTF